MFLAAVSACGSFWLMSRFNDFREHLAMLWSRRNPSFLRKSVR